MISKKLLKEINLQINYELFSSYYYLAMAAWLESEGYSGGANFFKVQAQEEVAHAMRFFHYVNEAGGRVILDALEKPKSEFKSLSEIFDLALEHEKFVTSRINLLMSIARKENDYASESMLKWFIDEQVEEEASMHEYIDKLKMVGGKGHGLLMIDQDLAGRVYTPAKNNEQS